MKNIFFIFLIIGLSVKGQVAGNAVDTFGTWGYLQSTTGNFNAFNNYDVQGYHVLTNWSTLKPTYAGAYDWSYIDKLVDSAVVRKKWIAFLTLVGQGSPAWVLDSAGSFMTEGGNVVGPYPRYYNKNGYQKFYYQFLRDFAAHLGTYTPQQRQHILYWQIAEGSTGDEQPYKGVLDSCQAFENCTTADTLAHPSLGDPLIPQSRHETKWGDFRKASWDSIAMSSQYGAISEWLYLMFNSGNNGAELDYVTGDSAGVDDDWYIQSHFDYLPLQPFIKEGQMSHSYSFRGELPYYNRQGAPSRGEIQGYIKTSDYPYKEFFALMCSALTGGLSMINIDQGWPPLIGGASPRSITDFFTKYTITKSEGFSIPTLRVDVMDSINYTTETYGQIIDTTPTGQYKYKVSLYNYDAYAAATNYNEAYVDWQYTRVVDKNKNLSRSNKLGLIYPNALHGNSIDSTYWNDYVTASARNYEKNLYQLQTRTTVIPQYRVGAVTNGAGLDTALLGRFAGLPKLDGNNKCIWYYNVDNKLIKNTYGDTVQVTIAYLDNASGGSISVSCMECGEKVVKGDVTTVTGNTNKWLYKTVEIPKFQFRTNGFDFMIDFVGNVTIGMVQFKNKNKL